MPVGDNLGPYRLLEKIGEGGMGEVYRAHDARLQRTVAIKILAPPLATPDRIARFEQEARSASALNHPNILTIHDVGRHGDTAYFAMEWVQGGTLRDELRAGPIAHRRTIQLAQQIAEGLAAAHAAGIVHRDLKPENVMLRADGLAKIVDFGLAKLTPAHAGTTSDADLTVTRSALSDPGVVMGTVGYMSPEQASGRAVDYRSDQFALGLLIYELVTARRPFARPTTAQSLAATIEADPPPLESVRPDVPPQLAAVVRRLLAKNPDERYESTRDLARELRTLSEATSAKPLAGTAPGRRKKITYAATVAALVLVVAAVFTLWRRPAPVLVAPADIERPLTAVRPFRSLSANSEQAYFAAGMTEEIRGQLSQVSAVRLLSRNGLDAYNEDVPRAVRDLGLRHLVDGSVRVGGSRVRVSVELVDAATQQTLWSQQYDRDLADVLSVQSEIAQQIARALNATLSPSEQLRIEKRPTNNLEAYTLFLRARQSTGADRARELEAIEQFRRALALDPDFALARAHLAYRLMFRGSFDGDAAYFDQAIAEAEAATRTDPTLPYAYFALGSAYSRKGMPAQSRQAFLRALELDPNNTSAMANLSIEEIRRARLDDSAYWGRRTFLRSGKTPIDFYHLIVPLMNLRADVESRVLLEEAERTTPFHPRIQLTRAILELFEGQTAGAITRADTLIARLPNNQEVKSFRANLALLVDDPELRRWVEPLMERSASGSGLIGVTHRLIYAYVLRRQGEAAKAAALIAEADRQARQEVAGGNAGAELRLELAVVSALQSDVNAAIKWLQDAHETGYRDYGFIERLPMLTQHLGDDPRFLEIIDRMRSDVAAQRERARARGLLDLTGLLTPQ